MSQPVKLSDALVLEARLAGEAQERSIAGQVEFWAKLGRSIDELLGVHRLEALMKHGKTERLSDVLREVDTAAGQERVAAVLRSRPYPHFEPCQNRPGFFVRIEADGARAIGRFMNREFVVEPGAKGSGKKSHTSGKPQMKAAAAD